jgi:hypothetical protein
LIKGNPAAKIEEIENVEYVFKHSIGYDSAKLIASVRGAVGRRWIPGPQPATATAWSF